MLKPLGHARGWRGADGAHGSPGHWGLEGGGSGRRRERKCVYRRHGMEGKVAGLE